VNRQQRRAAKKMENNAEAKKISEKIFQFNKLPEACSTCTKPFDKKDKTMLQSWNVVVKQETVRLFCPECMQKAQEVVNKYEQSNNENIERSAE
tara:strand:- start:571 stop:852 length:282 start_codon:yes stop_codon:yes gene_type:complete